MRPTHTGHMTDRIRAELLRSKYCPEPHLVITIDGMPLDQLIADSTENPDLLGFVPAWLDDLTDPAERAVVWDRIHQPIGTNIAVPVLMCPDDLDFWCTDILADTPFQPTPSLGMGWVPMSAVPMVCLNQLAAR